MMDKYSDLEFRDATEEEKGLINDLWVEEINRYYSSNVFKFVSWTVILLTLVMMCGSLLYYSYVTANFEGFLFILVLGVVMLIVLKQEYELDNDKILVALKNGEFQVCPVLASYILRDFIRNGYVVINFSKGKRKRRYVINIYDKNKNLLMRRVRVPLRCVKAVPWGDVKKNSCFFEALLIRINGVKNPLVVLLLNNYDDKWSLKWLHNK